MKVFAIQKSTNTYAPQFKQNSSINQTSVTKTNLSGDKFVRQVSFGASIDDLEAQLTKLTKKLELKEITEEAYEKAAKPIRKEIRRLSQRLGINRVPDEAGDEIDLMRNS